MINHHLCLTSCLEAIVQAVEERLLRVHAVLRLVEDYALRAIYHLRCLFEATCSRETVHEDGVGLRHGHHFVIHLVWHEDGFSLIHLGIRNTVAHPRVGVHHIGTLSRFLHVGSYDYVATESLALINHLALHFIALALVNGTTHGDFHANERPKPHEVVGDVVSYVAKERQLQTFARTLLLNDRLQVRKHLARMSEVVKGVNNGH
mmetsp:Transcript_12740/g.24894  ORF Transcript_12740/g.24894 Transcript_12740/m.24894 type:complete len:205 (-) Transcript_12740:276-890(-)